MIEKKELLEKYYAEHPEWEQRRFELIKGFAIAQLNASMVSKNSGHVNTLILKGNADKVLALINNEIDKIINSK